jgi:hypothetical protein
MDCNCGHLQQNELSAHSPINPHFSLGWLHIIEFVFVCLQMYTAGAFFTEYVCCSPCVTELHWNVTPEFWWENTGFHLFVSRFLHKVAICSATRASTFVRRSQWANSSGRECACRLCFSWQKLSHRLLSCTKFCQSAVVSTPFSQLGCCTDSTI